MRNLNILDIPENPTVINGVHESLYRSYHILNLVVALLEKNVPPEVVLAIIVELRNVQHLTRSNETSQGG